MKVWWQIISFWKVNSLSDPDIGQAQCASTGWSICLVQGGFVNKHGEEERGDGGGGGGVGMWGVRGGWAGKKTAG